MSIQNGRFCAWQTPCAWYSSRMSTKKTKSTPLKKPAPSSQGAKKAAPKKSSLKKKRAPLKKSSQKGAATPAPDQLTQNALKLVDQAAALLRKGIKTSSKATYEARTVLHQEAHTLLEEASSHLDHAIQTGTTFLRNALKKI